MRLRKSFADQPARHRFHVHDGGVQVEQLEVKHLFAAEGEELPRQRGGPFARVFDLLELASMGRVLVLQNELAEAQDGREEVVEIVGDPRPRAGPRTPSSWPARTDSSAGPPAPLLAAARVSQRDLVNPEPDRPSIRERHRLLDVDLRRIRLHDEAAVRDVEMGGGLPGDLVLALDGTS